MKGSFLKFAEGVTLGKLHSTADELSRIFKNFSEHPLLQEFLDDYFCQGTVFQKFSYASVPVTEFTSKVNLNRQ